MRAVAIALWQLMLLVVVVCQSPAAIMAVQPAGLEDVKHVVVIGYDGMSPEGIGAAKTPNIDRLVSNGSHTFHARGVMPTVSSPNWASMIMGAGPEQHGVTSNAWMPDKFEIAPAGIGSGGIFPTMFGLLRTQRPSSVIAVFHDWDGFGRLVEKGVADTVEHVEGPEATMKAAITFISVRKPALTFIHLDHVDHAGHEHGWGGAEYIKSIELADRLTGDVIEALKKADMFDNTILLLTADHGGVGKKHGESTMTEIEIPWIIHGPGVAAGKQLTAPVNTYDTAATVAFVLGLKPSPLWIAKPVVEAFAANPSVSGSSR
jgi:predicted AlkP superfamily pyrophosphatase or phosphodiesterase